MTPSEAARLLEESITWFEKDAVNNNKIFNRDSSTFEEWLKNHPLKNQDVTYVGQNCKIHTGYIYSDNWK